MISYNFVKRYSPDADFILTKWDAAELATLLQEASLSFPYYNDLDGKYTNENARVSLYGCFYNVKNIENGLTLITVKHIPYNQFDMETFATHFSLV